ncbi:metallophosphoesterase family protein [Pelagicoccus mobilis]|uniref:Metallophosphoesterase n=1 Tax=Pelagicoccus mobilis TaxID=415221 RepID=A0A934RUP6_9BACT|nr:metallophosphoesterase [Pelagicoccus mobilis]MBK1876776.1 metallophosphoesterase [Pelagicoccus mobilis]
MNRRTFLASSTAIAASATSPSLFSQTPQAPKRSLRIAHMTDIHVMSGKNAPEKMAMALQHVQSLSDKPDLILNGGDSIMDALKKSKAETRAQWREWRAVLKNELELPFRSAIGNHDVWGWALDDRRRNVDYGKNWAMEELGLKDRYYSFSQAGWQFVVLDSVYFDAASSKGYTARLDEKQFAWLAQTLAELDASKPICILSHIPIISFCPFFDGENEKSGNWHVPGPWMHIDARRIKDLFAQHSNIKLALSGHIHLADQVRYLGIDYLCNGAVCGGWWDGPYQEFPPAYVLVDLYEDGSHKSEFVPYLKG